jgi:hypothetical protein
VSRLVAVAWITAQYTLEAVLVLGLGWLLLMT